jgi:hypothetical protein
MEGKVQRDKCQAYENYCRIRERRYCPENKYFRRLFGIINERQKHEATGIFWLLYNLMGPPTSMQSIVGQNVIWHIRVVVKN